MDSNRPITDFSDDELRKYACEHVLYEITHFVRANNAIEAARWGMFPTNFALEVYALHTRNLLDFFMPRNPRKTDACAKHFFKGWKQPKLTLPLEQARWQADKHVAHLTTDRTSDVNLKEWYVNPITRDLVAIIERFAEGAELVCDSFRRDVGDRIAELPPHRDWTEMPPQMPLATGMLPPQTG